MSNLYYVVHEKRKVKWKINDENILKYSSCVCVCLPMYIIIIERRKKKNDKTEQKKVKMKRQR